MCSYARGHTGCYTSQKSACSRAMIASDCDKRGKRRTRFCASGRPWSFIQLSLRGRIWQANSVFPALPRDLAFGITSIGSEQNPSVEKNGRYVIDDEFEGKLVTRQFQAVADLPEKEQDHANKSG